MNIFVRSLINELEEDRPVTRAVRPRTPENIYPRASAKDSLEPITVNVIL
jgi:hypothetical protein